jgi:mannose-6-phosphate isomerase-like protein (cupin superfamily)
MHYHLLKKETFYILSGKIILTTYNLDNADPIETLLGVGSVIDIPTGNPHQIEAVEATTILEVSTQHFEEDSYRIIKGDSQK